MIYMNGPKKPWRLDLQCVTHSANAEDSVHIYIIIQVLALPYTECITFFNALCQYQ